MCIIRSTSNVAQQPQSPPPFCCSALFLVFAFDSSIHFSYAPLPCASLSFTTPFNSSPTNPTKLCRRNAFSHNHAFRFCSSISSVSSSPSSLARIRRSCTHAKRLKRISVAGYRLIRRCRTGITLSGNSCTVHLPWEIGAGWSPSSS